MPASWAWRSAASDTSCGCSARRAPAPRQRRRTGRARAARPAAARAEARPAPARIAKASYHVGDYGKPLETVAVKTSEVHAIDARCAAIAVPAAKDVVAAIAPKPSDDSNDASHCLKVDSDGSHWGFRNACDFAVQFAYCMAGGDDSLTACGKDVHHQRLGQRGGRQLRRPDDRHQPEGKRRRAQFPLDRLRRRRR